MPPVASSLPALYGSDALLKVLSDEGEHSVYLLAQGGASEPRVVKLVPAPGAPALEALDADIRCLCRMRSAYLAKMLDSIRVDGELGIVTEHVHGKSLAKILERVKSGSHLLPPEVGLVLAHDAFAAVEYFHEFERGSRVHGNITERTLMLAYTGEVKVLGYRPGLHPRPEVDAQAGKDVVAIAGLLGDVSFKMFPRQLVQALPRLLDGNLSPLETVATAKAFVRDYVPSTDDRGKVAKWLEETFPGERKQEAKEYSRLLAAGLKLVGDRGGKPTRGEASDSEAAKKAAEHVVPITQPAAVSSEVSVSPVASPPPAAEAPPLTVVAPRAQSSSATERIEGDPSSRRLGLKLAMAGAAALVILVGGIFLVRACRSGVPGPDQLAAVSSTKVVPAALVQPPVSSPLDTGAEAGPAMDSEAKAEPPTLDPEAALAAAEAAQDADDHASVPEGRSARRREKPAVARFLRTANVAFDRGKPLDAVKWATRALSAGGGLRAHLTLARYLRSIHRYREALVHYRAALALAPDNKLAATGVEVLENQRATTP